MIMNSTSLQIVHRRGSQLWDHAQSNHSAGPITVTLAKRSRRQRRGAPRVTTTR